jgi:guanylate kinase
LYLGHRNGGEFETRYILTGRRFWWINWNGREGRSLTFVNLQGVKQVKKTDLNARFLFLQPPSVEVLEQRLRGRASDSEEAILARLKQAENEIAYSKTPGVHDAIVVNDDLEKAWVEFKAFCAPEESK